MRVKKKSGYHHGDLRRTLIAAAEQLITSQGPAALTLRETARRAGVSTAAPYRHFADKEALLAAVLTEGFSRLTVELGAARANAKGPLDALTAVGKAYVDFASRNGPIYRMMFGPSLDKSKHPELEAAGMEALSVLVQVVTACHEAGLLVKGPIEELALSGWALCHGLSSLHTDGALAATIPVDVHRAGKRLIDLLLHGVLKRP